MISYSVDIRLPIETVYKHFLSKIEQPQNFVPGVSNVIIKEKTPDHVVRAMDITTPDGKKETIVERITHSPYWVKFQIIGHPLYTGHVDNIAERISKEETKITFTREWRDKKTGELYSNVELIKNAVLKTRDYILSIEEKYN